MGETSHSTGNLQQGNYYFISHFIRQVLLEDSLTIYRRSYNQTTPFQTNQITWFRLPRDVFDELQRHFLIEKKHFPKPHPWSEFISPWQHRVQILVQQEEEEKEKEEEEDDDNEQELYIIMIKEDITNLSYTHNAKMKKTTTTGVIILPIQTMHCHKGTPSKQRHRFVLFASSNMGPI